MANSVQAGTPPRENTRVLRSIDVVLGRGVRASSNAPCSEHAVSADGLVQAFAAHHLALAARAKLDLPRPARPLGIANFFSLGELRLSKAKLSS